MIDALLSVPFWYYAVALAGIVVVMLFGMASDNIAAILLGGLCLVVMFVIGLLVLGNFLINLRNNPTTMDAIIGFFLSWYFLIGVLCAGLLFEIWEVRTLTVVAVIAAAVIAYVKFDVTWTQLGVTVVCYLLVGSIWSVWRFYRYASTATEKHLERIKSGGLDNTERNNREILNRLQPANNVEKIVAWIIVWPISAVESIVGDVIRLLKLWVTKALIKIFDSIYAAVTKPITDASEKKS